MPSSDWPHAPLHRIDQQGTYMVTGGTYRKETFFNTNAKLDMMLDTLLEVASDREWQLQAWAVMANHYHFVAVSPDNAATLGRLVAKFHMLTAKGANQVDGVPGRRVWYQYWDSRITYERSYLARLHYVHTNPVHHGVVPVATAYRWCSAGWFERTADRAFRRTVESFKTDGLSVVDDF